MKAPLSAYHSMVSTKFIPTDTGRRDIVDLPTIPQVNGISKLPFIESIVYVLKWDSFALVLIAPTDLVYMDRTQKKCCFAARLVGLISTKTKE